MLKKSFTKTSLALAITTLSLGFTYAASSMDKATYPTSLDHSKLVLTEGDTSGTGDAGAPGTDNASGAPASTSATNDNSGSGTNGNSSTSNEDSEGAGAGTGASSEDSGSTSATTPPASQTSPAAEAEQPEEKPPEEATEQPSISAENQDSTDEEQGDDPNAVQPADPQTSTTTGNEIISVLPPAPVEPLAPEQTATTSQPSTETYSNIQYQAARQARSASLAFSENVHRFTVGTDKIHTYADYHHDYTSYDFASMSGKASTLYSGNDTVSGMTVGAFTQVDSINYGLALTYNSNKFTTTKGKNQVSDATVKSTGLTFSASQPFADYYIGGSLYGYYHSNQVHRGMSDMLSAKFKGSQLGAAFEAGYRAYQDGMSSVVVTGALVVERNAHKAFTETGSDAMQAMALVTKANSHVDAYALVGAKYLLDMSLAGLHTQLDAGVTCEQALTKNKFNLKLADGTTTPIAFTKKFVTKLSLGYTVDLAPSLAVKLAGNYETNTDWNNREVMVTAKYSF